MAPTSFLIWTVAPWCEFHSLALSTRRATSITYIYSSSRLKVSGQLSRFFGREKPVSEIDTLENVTKLFARQAGKPEEAALISGRGLRR
jgi:hypothetical protein